MQNQSSKNPYFIGIGAQKAGTSWLYKKLIRHPQIWIAPAKEIHFFDRVPSCSPSPFTRLFDPRKAPSKVHLSEIKSAVRHGNIEKISWYCKFLFGYYDENWYVDLFSTAKSHQIAGEITPAYSKLGKEDIARISAINSDVKLIFLLRNPIDRTWSQLRFHNKRSSRKLTSTNEIIPFLQTKEVTLRSDYERTLDNYLAYFDSSQILVGFYDAIIDNQSGLLTGITDFLGVSPFEESLLNKEIYVNVSPSQSIPKEVKDYLVETYTPSIERLAKYLGSYAAKWYAELKNDGNQSSSTSIDTALTPVVNL
ncbi:MAG: sulfotransferase domain-containing protein [Microcystaceae cyanobacterium]